MTEHIKFTFKSTNKERAILWQQFHNKFIMLDEAVHFPTNSPLDYGFPDNDPHNISESIWPVCVAIGGHRMVADIWTEIPDDCGDGRHTLQFDMIPMNETTEATLESIEVSGIEFKFTDKNWENIITTYQLTWVDNFVYKNNGGELVTKDLNRDNQLQSNKYWKFKWSEEQTIYGRGSWTFTFSFPFDEWWDNLYNDNNSN